MPSNSVFRVFSAVPVFRSVPVFWSVSVFRSVLECSGVPDFNTCHRYLNPTLQIKITELTFKLYQEF